MQRRPRPDVVHRCACLSNKGLSLKQQSGPSLPLQQAFIALRDLALTACLKKHAPQIDNSLVQLN